MERIKRKKESNKMLVLLISGIIGIPIALYFDAKQWKCNNRKSKIFKIYLLFFSIVVLVAVCTK